MPLSWLPLISDYTRDAEKPTQATWVSVLVYGAVLMLADGGESTRRLKRGWEYVPVVWAGLAWP